MPRGADGFYFLAKFRRRTALSDAERSVDHRLMIARLFGTSFAAFPCRAEPNYAEFEFTDAVLAPSPAGLVDGWLIDVPYAPGSLEA